MQEECIFCRIGSGVVPVSAVYEDQEILAFRDQNPQAPVHVLVVPRAHYATILDVHDASFLGRMLVAVNETARRLGLAESGFRIVVNTRDDGGQSVGHLHFHVLGGRFLQWPPG